MTLPVRRGARPWTGPHVPHIQLTQTGSPEFSVRLSRWIVTQLPGVHSAPSEISDPAGARHFLTEMFPQAELPDDLQGERALGFFIDREAAAGVLLLPPSRTREFAHLHDDGSLHLALPAGIREAVVAAGWGERHPYFGPRVNVTLLFGPRDDEELEIAKRCVRAAYDYAVGAVDVAA